MQISVEYAAQLKRAAGTGRETVAVPSEATLCDLVRCIIDRHGEALKPLLLNGSGELHPSILVFINNEQCRDVAGREMHAGDVVAFLPPISGG